MKQIAICFFSAAAGMVFGSWLLTPTSSLPAASGQQAADDTGLQIPPVNIPTPACNRPQSPAYQTAEPRAYDADGLTPDEAAAAFVYESNNRSVANIATRIGGERFLFRENPTEDAGSGFVIDKAGHILTNFHVVEGAQRILVTLFDGETYEAETVGGDAVNDIAVIRVDAPAELLVPVTIADSSVLKVGMKVFAIGNPFGLERTMTTGIISSLNRTLPVTRARSIKSVIQIDAAINPGNSGGPLLDAHGRLIGMNTAIASRTGQNSGIGFAIPSNLISRVIPELIEHGRVIRPDIGISQVLKTEAGLRILRMDPDGPAARAGLKGPQLRRRKSGFVVFEVEDRSVADLIVGVNGKKTLKVDEFLSEVESHHPGDTITVNVIRDGKPFSVKVTLGR
ncbi:S1C family serine protease [Fuerstiella marisgermanici]|uniref:Periplasmic serine endoprotease DegP n=1 Tax=Fuerstiella marisgermanici TaxID=1891926 RepID=A0A1P8W9P6_9PLAN|nr:trypsin-like peptidase domain-containing protein [Fuerstiella marisgermanici]APZ90786.1 Periplasmic serine endoprotease DegP precursor [Fuerstiella marisgermanici]